MRRHATTSLEALDPDVLAAAREVARRAGVPVESWIASVLPSDAKAAPPRRRRPAMPAETQAAAPVPAAAPAPSAPNLDTILDALIERLDTIDRAIADERETAQDAASRRIESLEARISEVLDSRSAPVRQVDDRLGEIERRMVELGEQFAASRPPGRRGRAAVEEVRDAVEEIRRRRREIESELPVAAAPVEDPVAAMRRDLARRLDAAVEIESKPSATAAIAELRQEIGRLRDSVGSLATGKDVGALEQAMLTLAGDVKRAQQPADLAAIAAPIEAIRAQVERLAGDVSDNVYDRVAGEFERVSQRIESALAAGPNGGADQAAVSGLFSELEEIRHVTAALAGPERIQGLVQAVQALSGQIEGLRAGFGTAESGMAQLRPLLEEIRSGLDARRPQETSEQFKAIAQRLDALQGGSSGIDSGESRTIIGRIDALADKMDRVGSQGAPQGGDLASIQAMLGSLADKVDTVGRRSGGGEGLDALEKQVLAIAKRLDTRGADPALAGLERTMADLMSQVSALRDEAATVTAVERAARTAVADTIGETPELGLLRSGLADLQARQAASDERMQVTLDGVRGAIDRLVLKISDPLADPPRADARAPSLDDRLMSSTGVQPPRGRSGQRPEAARAPAIADTGRMTDELLEPGAGRPQRSRILSPSQEAEPAEGAGDIKGSFIAAARRAAQAAHAEVAAEGAEAVARSEKPRTARRGIAADLPEPVAPQRSPGLRATIDKRRKPLLLGLAAIVLVLGALQALTMSSDPAPVSQPPLVEKRSAAPAETARPAPADPQTTQSISEPAAQAKTAPASIPATTPAQPPASARSALPQVTGMQALAGDLAGLPTGLAGLKQAALDGDGASVYELAVREADGRGMPRDLAVAAKLYEKLASAGYAPAQYRLAGQYEKGSGVIRDLAQAKLWYARAAEQGHARSMHNLAVIYAENPGPSGKPDFASAASWFRQAAEYGIRDSQYNLAVLYARGLGLGQDLAQSYAWFSAAATQGDTEAAKKRDDVTGKLSPDDLAKAKTITANFKPRKADPAVNEGPAAKDAPPAAMSLLGAPAPGAGLPGFTPPVKR